MIRTTNHQISYSNKNKLHNLSSFIDEYRKVAKVIIDEIWKNGYSTEIETKDGIRKIEFNIQKDLLEIPSFIDYNKFNIDTKLSARALSSLVTQLVGIIKATTEVRRKRLFVFNKLCEENKYNERLYLNLQKFQVLKPNIENLNPELSSKCCDYEKSVGYFNGFIQLMSIGESFGKIRIPIKFHRGNRKYKDWSMKNSFLIGKDFVNIRWSKEIEKKTVGIEVGGDQGKLTILTLSDRQVTPKTDNHGYSLDSIIDKLSRKKKGSKAFEKAQKHRKNFINWSINQLNFNNIKHIKLEEVININYGKRSSRLMSHWTNTIIRDKIRSHCEVNGVHFTLQSCTYRSQRCSQCGLVRKSNRKGKVYVCSCGYSDDADFNASCNHEQTLPDIPIKLRKLNLNRKGFYWKETGFYDLTGMSLESILSNK
jgi:hypothetical protein